MAQEFFINSQDLEDQIRKLLPSQGGAGAGFDLSASTQIIPIIDLTETAEGSGLREDLQSSFSFANTNAFAVTNAVTSIITNTGFYRIFGIGSTFGAGLLQFRLLDGVGTKELYQQKGIAGQLNNNNFDFIIFLAAGDSFSIRSDSTSSIANGSFRQIATIDGTLVNPI